MSKKIILTRSVEDNKILGDLLLALNYSVIEFPAIKIVDHFNLNQKISLEQYDCLVFTSGKAIQAARRYFEYHDLIIPKGTLIAVVGQASAKVLQECFRRTPNLVASRSDSDSLALDLIQLLTKNQKILFLAGNLTLDTMPRQLREHGYAVDVVEIYHNILPIVDPFRLQEILEEDPVNLIFPFYSPSAVENCIKLLGKDCTLHQKTKIISIGQQTTARLLAVQLVPAIELANPCQQDLIAAISNLA